MPRAVGRATQVLSPGGGLRWGSRSRPPDLLVRISLPGVRVLKLRVERHWSWWRVSLPLWAVLGHNILYISIGFIWLNSLKTMQQKKRSQSAQGMVSTVTRSQRWYAFPCSRITC